MQDSFQAWTQRHSISVLAPMVVSDIPTWILEISTRVHFGPETGGAALGRFRHLNIAELRRGTERKEGGRLTRLVALKVRTG